MSKKVGQVIVDTLVAAGVKHCYGIVGDTLNTVATCLAHSDIQFVHMRHEESGAFAAQEREREAELFRASLQG